MNLLGLSEEAVEKLGRALVRGILAELPKDPANLLAGKPVKLTLELTLQLNKEV